MPRVNAVTAIGRKREELRKYITGKRHAEDITLADLGEKLCKTPQGVKASIDKGNIQYQDLVIIFREIGASDEDIIKMMRME